jgi:MFS family permease
MLLGAAARLPYGMGAVGLLVVGRFQDLSTATSAGLASLFTLGLALATPVWGGIADRRGIRRVLLLCIGFDVAGTVAIALDKGAGPSLVGAALVGVGTPPLAATMRATWNRLLPPGVPQERAAALESALAEGVHIVGRLVVALLAELHAELIMPVACGLLLVAGLPLAMDRRLRPSAYGLSTVTVREVIVRSRAILFLTVIITIAHGAVATAVVLGAGTGSPFAGPLFMACWGLGSAFGGLALATRGAVSAQTLITRGLATFGALTAVSVPVFGRDPVTSVLLSLLLGAPLSPMFAGLYRVAANAATRGRETQTLSLISSMVVIGFSVGSSLAGLVGSFWSPREGGFTVAAVSTLAALLISLSFSRPAEM